MYEQIEKSKENTASANRRESRAVANSVGQKQSNVKQGFGFVDNRPEAVAQRKLQEMANNSGQAKQTAQLLAMAGNNSVQKKQSIPKKDAHFPNNSAPIQRAILKTDNDASSLVQAFLVLKNHLILDINDAENHAGKLNKLVTFLENQLVIDALNVLRETDPAFNLSDIEIIIRDRLGGVANPQTSQVLANNLSKDTVTRAVLSEDDSAMLSADMEMSEYITTDAERAEIRRQELMKTEIEQIKQDYGNYADIFNHIFKGEFKVNGDPKGYHTENGGSVTHETYGGTTNLANNTYQKSVRAIVGGRIKPIQSTFFPAGESVDNVKLAVVSGDKAHGKIVKYPLSMAGMPLVKTGGTIYPNTGNDKNAE